jgi:[ribosomal protein S5]-alanine N-acetyltransferase
MLSARPTISQALGAQEEDDMASIQPGGHLPFPAMGDSKVRLAPLVYEHAPMVTALHSDPDVIRWTYWLQHDQIDAITYIEGVERLRNDGLGVTAAVIDRESNQAVGTSSLHLVAEGVGEIGINLLGSARRRRVASHTVVPLAQWGFDALGLHRVQALIRPDNHASINAFTRLGFQAEGTLRAYRPQRGQEGDRIIYSVLPGELRLIDR